ncbi:DUF1918 domain-containing protein [Nonomuraea harbinensis]|uniref:DUF1918 domain-containing protein n=1 Tax=Nonomuraea harbinensis TaxID=1286938 RepID=A0ABW1CBM1_9ACTN|nr:DUF1918 domain-containing protein [Nonomuraea harbinensis]
MRATVGDRLIVEGTCGAGSRRKGIVMGVEHADGTPPYRVRWLDDGRESLVFPGRGARVVPRGR